jgi:hypothetical protein
LALKGCDWLKKKKFENQNENEKEKEKENVFIVSL